MSLNICEKCNDLNVQLKLKVVQYFEISESETHSFQSEILQTFVLGNIL